jgi:hypothetical protein
MWTPNVDDVMAGARGDQNCVRIVHDMFLLLVEDKLGLTLLDAEERIAVTWALSPYFSL